VAREGGVGGGKEVTGSRGEEVVRDGREPRRDDSIVLYDPMTHRVCSFSLPLCQFTV